MFYFHTSFWCQKGFTKAGRPSYILFEAPQRSVKIKICHFLKFQLIVLGCLEQKGLIKFFLLESP